MWFKKTRPPIPKVDDYEKFVEWLLKYADDLEPIRKLYKPDLDRFIEINVKSVLQEIRDRNLNSSDAIMERAGEIGEFFEEKFRPLIGARGGLEFCPPDLRAGAAMLIAKMSALLYIAKHKYDVPIPEELFRRPRI
jgi:hypothetical protein